MTAKPKQRHLTHNWSGWHTHTGYLTLFTWQPNLVWLTTSPMDLKAPRKSPGKQRPMHPPSTVSCGRSQILAF